ncbi:BRCA1-A complex subunit RAP80 isoform X2 [Leucoraja erinacea]|uniref:BRCA1-A complex subunit RAP80 isoform X2 n=2 Tax=Leucoraja erinaceus TaxID=7782 RepID=UPI0024544499|nr:BRCA1-A complex subunit RAP80 isoform X2 [Leucoraja erinacea]
MGSPSTRWAAATGSPGRAVPPPPAGESRDQPVNYFWGIPFCPAGLDPDQYTRVLLCQLQAYERCLKRAQSRSLTKAHFGPPLLPGPGPGSALSRHGHGAQLDKADLAAGDKEVMKTRPDAGGGRTQSLNVCAEEILKDGGEENSEQGECDDTRRFGSSANHDHHLEDDVLFIDTAASATTRRGQRDPEAPDMHEETQQSLSEEIHPEGERPQGSDNDSTPEPEDLLLIEDEAEEFATISPSKKPAVECPICGQPFPLEKIEVHAADCNGACDGGSELQVQTRSHTRKVARKNCTAGSNLSTLRLRKAGGRRNLGQSMEASLRPVSATVEEVLKMKTAG